jgi:hypothetical protein
MNAVIELKLLSVKLYDRTAVAVIYSPKYHMDLIMNSLVVCYCYSIEDFDSFQDVGHLRCLCRFVDLLPIGTKISERS